MANIRRQSFRLIIRYYNKKVRTLVIRYGNKYPSLRGLVLQTGIMTFTAHWYCSIVTTALRMDLLQGYIFDGKLRAIAYLRGEGRINLKHVSHQQRSSQRTRIK